MIDVSDPQRPTVESEYKLPQNQEFLCDVHEPRPRTSCSAHDPTLTPNIAFSTWHSGGFQAISIEDPTIPFQRPSTSRSRWTRSCWRIRASRPTRTPGCTRRS
jgi:hypothetical protein